MASASRYVSMKAAFMPSKIFALIWVFLSAKVWFRMERSSAAGTAGTFAWKTARVAAKNHAPKFFRAKSAEKRCGLRFDVLFLVSLNACGGRCKDQVRKISENARVHDIGHVFELFFEFGGFVNYTVAPVEDQIPVV